MLSPLSLLTAIYALTGVVFGLVAALIGRDRGWSPALAFLVGFLLGIIGLLIIALVRGTGPTAAELEMRRQWERRLQEHWQSHEQEGPGWPDQGRSGPFT